MVLGRQQMLSPYAVNVFLFGNILLLCNTGHTTTNHFTGHLIMTFKAHTFFITPDHAVVMADLYGKLISAKQYVHSPAALNIGNKEAAAYVEVLLKEFDKPTNWALAMAEGTVMFLKGAYGTIAVYKYGYRRKLTIVAPDYFWEVAEIDPEDLERKMVKWLSSHHYIASAKNTTVNLDAPFVVAHNW